MTTATETVGQRIKRIRLERRLSQRDLTSPGVSYAYISLVEAGKRSPSVLVLRRIAEKLGVSADYLETGEDSIRLRVPVGLSDRARSDIRRVLQEQLDRAVAKASDRG